MVTIRPQAAALAALLLVVERPAAAQPAAFRFRADRARTGVTLHYLKSNLDGTNPSAIALFVAGPLELESFKWHQGGGSGTLVVASFDSERLTVKRFESRRITAEGQKPVALLEAGPGADDLTMEVNGKRSVTAIGHWPWHSYDFDFAGLGLAMRHLVRPEKTFTIGIADVNYQEDLRFVDKGTVEVRFVGRGTWRGRPVREYAIDGPGLENRGGKLFVDLGSGFLAGYEIDLPDEPGMKSVRLELQGIEPMTADRWLAFQRRQIGAER